MSENASPSLRRPGKLPLVLVSILMAVLLIFSAAASILVPQYYDMINSFLAPGPSGAEVSEARTASADKTREIAAEGMILLENKNNTLPLAQRTAVNVFGYGSRDTVYGGTGSGDSSNNVTIAQGLENAGFQVNQDLVSFYDEHFVERTGVGYTGSNFDINETPLSEYPDTLIEEAKAFSDVAIFVVSRFGGEGDMLFLSLEFGNNTYAICEYGSAFRWPEHYVLIQGTERAIRLDMCNCGMTVKNADGSEEHYTVHETQEEDDDRTRIYHSTEMDGAIMYGRPGKLPPLWLHSIMKNEMKYFNGIMHGEPVPEEFLPLMTGEAARAAIATADAATISLRENRKVMVSEVM